MLEKVQRPDANMPHMLPMGEEFDRAVSPCISSLLTLEKPCTGCAPSKIMGLLFSTSRSGKKALSMMRAPACSCAGGRRSA